MNFADYTRITIPEGKVNKITSGDKVIWQCVPAYHVTESERLIANIKAFKTAHPNHIVFGAVSDIHVNNTDATIEARSKKSIKHAGFALEKVGALAGCDFIANLGDNCEETHIDPTITSSADGLENAQYSVNMLKPALDRLTSFNLVGNHDKTNDTQTQYNLIGVHNDFDVASATTIRGFGYKDFTDKKVRVIVLNTCDYLNASGGCAMSYEQKDFLMRALDLSRKTNASSWQILLLSHIPLDWNGGDYNFYTDLQAILNAYEDGTTATITINSSYALNETPSNYVTYAGGKLVYNYSGKNVAQIIANIHGHVHTNKVSKIANTRIARVATANANPNGNKTDSYLNYGDYSISATEAAKIVKVDGTSKDTSATFYCIDLEEQTIYAFGYGADIDRTIIYNDVSVYDVEYNLTNCTSSNTAITVAENGAYTTTITLTENTSIESVVVTMGGTDITSTVYANGVINIANVTGDIVITAKAVAVASYTNVIDTAGTEDNVRLRSGGATASASGFASGYFPCKAGDTIRVYFPNGNRASIPSNGVYVALYSDNTGSFVAAYNTGQSQITEETDHGYTVKVPSSFSNIAYARVAGAPNGAYAGWIVTVNEEIT